MKKTNRIALMLGLLTASICQGNCQTNLNFNSVKATVEGAIKLSWNSTSNEVYRIDYANEIVDTNTGFITWQPLYTDYPSHGTNTFIADAGNYDLVPEIPHPKLSPMRFYRIALAATSTSPTNPAVAVTFPTNGASLSSNVTIVVSSSSPELLTDVKLYIDGEEQWRSDDDTNFVINTCEWPNGPHVLFAVAYSQSRLPGLPEDTGVTYGRAVSAYVNVTFDNLITRFDFSEPFFEPELGQTQRVTAIFTANVDWTIAVQDSLSNTVRSASGSGTSMAWDFDGKGYGGTNLPAGLYSYLLTAQTNGQQMMMMNGGGESFSSSSASLSGAEPLELWVLQGSGVSVPLNIYPPGMATNGLTIFEASESEVRALNNAVLTSDELVTKTKSATATESESGGGAEAAYSSPSQNTRGPTRKPKQGHIGKTGTYGIAFDTFPDGISCNPPRTGFPISPFYVKIDGNRTHFDADPIRGSEYIGTLFNQFMGKSGYKASFIKHGNQWTPSSISGANGIFNSVNLGILITHASWGDTTESDFVLHTYLWHNDATYARLGDLRLGSPGTNGLRWMTMFTCSSLRPANINSMSTHGVIGQVITEDLHLLLGMETTIVETPRTGWNYATNLVAEQTFPNAWFNALRSSLSLVSPPPTNTVVARVLGWNPCFDDTLHYYNDPDTSQGIFSRSSQVWP